MPEPFALVSAERGQRSPDLLLRRPVPASLHDLRLAAPDFAPDAQLRTAINVALAVGAPLLVTGDPGCGKTQLAYWLAWTFQVLDGIQPTDPPTPGLGPQPFKLQVKSTTTARDLLWTFDTVSWFHDGQDPERKGKPLNKKKYRTRGPLWEAFEALKRSRPAVVLIDEIDKAPRDFPNDLLHELDQYEFLCTDTGETAERPKGVAPPLVVITSNAERRLPEAFLRRCVFHHLEQSEDDIRAAVHRRAASMGVPEALTRVALERFLSLRQTPALRRRPGTGELLVWLWALHAAGERPEALARAAERDLPHLGALLKDRADLTAIGARRA